MITLTENTKHLLFIAFFVLFSLATGYALYYFFFRSLAPVPGGSVTEEYAGELGPSGPRGAVTSTQTPTQGTLPIGAGQAGTAEGPPTTGLAEPGDVTLIRDAVTQAVVSDAKGNTRYYNPEDGRFYKINPDGTLTLLSDRQFYNVQKIDWGKANDEAILEFPDGSNIYYSFEDQRQVDLPGHWSDFEFAPKDDRIVAKSLGLDENNRFLIVAKPDGNETTALYHLGANADLVIPSWSPNNQVIAFSRTGEPQADNAEQIFLLGPNHENYAALTVPGSGFVPNWSPSGKRLLYSVYHQRDDYRPMLWVSDASAQNIGRNRQRLNLMTWADKCAWKDDKSLICAVPMSLTKGAGYDRTQFTNIPDDVYFIDLETGASKKISAVDQNHPISQPTLNKDQSKLIFTDSVTGKLYSYTLHY